MLKKKLKKALGLLLTITVTANGLMVDMRKEAKAATQTYATFADAVEAWYENPEEYSSEGSTYDVKDFSNGELGIFDWSNNKLNATSNLCLNMYTSYWYYNGRYSGDVEVDNVTLTSKREKVLIEDVNTGKKDYWDYVVVQLYGTTDLSFDPCSTLLDTVIVGMRPNKESNLSGDITLPAYIEDREYGWLPCIELDDGSFLKDTDITNVTIPNTYKRICAYAFTGCTNLTDFKFVDVEKTLNSSENMIGYTISKVTSEGTKNGDFIQMLGSGAFAGCVKLKNAILPENLTEGYMYDNRYAVYNTYDNKLIKQEEKVVFDNTNYILNDRMNYILEHTKQYHNSPTEYAYKETNPETTIDYYMGKGIYRDCYEIREAYIRGINPFIPSHTFSGCVKISEINIEDSVKQIYFGVSSFAGDIKAGNALKNVELNCNVILGAYSFANCFKLENFTIRGILNNEIQDGNLDTQGIHRYEYTFENSFRDCESGSFILESSSANDNISSYRLTIPKGFFYNTKNLNTLSLYDDIYKQTGKTSTIIFDSHALENFNISKLEVNADTIYLNNSCMYGLGNHVKNITFNGDTYVCGELFSDVEESNIVADNNTIEKVVFNGNVQFQGATVTLTSRVSETPIIDETITTETYAAFYGLGSQAKIIYGEDCTMIQGTLKDFHSSTATGINPVYNGSEKRIFHYPYGNVTQIYILNSSCSINTSAIPKTSLSGYTIYTYNGKPCFTTIKDYITKNSDTMSDIHIADYVEGISFSTKNTYFVRTDKEFKPSRLKVIASYADGTEKEIPYSEAGDSYKGYVVTNLDTFMNKLKTENEYNIKIEYCQKIASEYVDIIDRQATDFNISEVVTGSAIEGTTASSKDFAISNIHYNDDTTETILEDYNNVKISLADGSTNYKLGQNDVIVEYLGHTETITVNAVPKEVVSITAKQSNAKLYENSTPTKNNFVVTATYNTGEIVEDFQDYTIVTTSINKDTTAITIETENGIQNKVDVAVTPLIAKFINVAYNGTGVVEGGLVDKSNFTNVTIIYDNGTSRKLDQDEYDLVYSTIIKNSSNEVKVIYKGDRSIYTSVYVTGISSGLVATPNEEINNEPIKDTNQTNTSNPTENNGNNTTANNNLITTSPNNTQITNGNPVTNSPSPIPTIPNAVKTPIPSTMVLDNTATGELTKKSLKLKLGLKEKVKLKLKAGSISSVASSDANIATVTNEGVITTKTTGKCSITIISSDNIEYTYTLTVKKAPKQIRTNFKSKTLKAGKKAKIKIKFENGYYSNSITFKSSNKKIAQVTSKGLVKALKKGNCKIIIKTFNGKKVYVKIIVKSRL